MQKTAPERLKLVQKLARLREQAAALKLADALRGVQASQQQQEQLAQYKTEYSQHFSQRAAEGQSAANLANFQRFYAELERANDTQQQRTVLATSQLDQVRAEWQRLHGREKNLQVLIERKQQQLDRELDNKLQRQLDDRPISKQPGTD